MRTIAVLGMLAATVVCTRAEEFYIRAPKTRVLFGPYEFKEGTEIVGGIVTFPNDEVVKILKLLKEVRIPEVDYRRMQREAAEASITRLALWRMDAAVSSLIIAESARPYYEYAAFNPAETVNPVVYNRTATNATLVPSPLLTQSPSNVLAYFNGSIAADGSVRDLASPQVPTGKLNDWVLSNYGGATGIINVNSDNFATFATGVTIADLQEAFGEPGGATGIVAAVPVPPQVEQATPRQQAPAVQQMAMNANDQAARYYQSLRGQRRVQSTKQQVYAQNTIAFENVKSTGGKLRNESKPTASDTDIGPWGTPAPEVDEGVMKAAWIDDKLVLGRLVTINNERYVQGAWLNWDMLRRELLAEVGDILPSARLNPVAGGGGDGGAHLMATLPVRLSPGPCATLPAPAASAFNAPLATAWACVLIAALAVGILAAGGNVTLSVRDHGPGISAREAKRLFRPFRKSAQHAAETAPGVGLGLALSRQLARRMGGSLRIDTAVADGARVTLTLPVA